MHIEVTQVVKAPREKIFEAWTDFEAAPKFSTIITKVTVTKRQGNTVHTVGEGKLMGRKLETHEKHTLTPPEKDVTELEAKGSKGKLVMKFDSVPEGTRLTWTQDIDVKGFWATVLGPFAKRRLQAAFRKETQAFATYVEALK